MSHLTNKIKASIPTHTGEHAHKMVEDLFADPDYVLFFSTIYGLPKMEEMSNTFLDCLANAKLPSGDEIKIYDPIFIAKDSYPDSDVTFYLLFYNNGAIFYADRNPIDTAIASDPVLILLLKKEILEELGISFSNIEQVAFPIQ